VNGAGAGGTAAIGAGEAEVAATDAEPLGPGVFVAIVGASGVGKDSLIDYVRARVDDGVHFPRRVITRPAGPGEDFEPIEQDGFADAARRGAFAVRWHAHGLEYGIPASADHQVRAGRVVVVNVSRAVLAGLRTRYRRLLVVRVTVSDEVRAERLRSRRREEPQDIARRLARADPAPDFPVDAEIRNDGTLAEGGEQLMRVITDAARPLA
jgi:ribose 1,5-bisphosphokinase